jgi:hypothetical protein
MKDTERHRYDMFIRVHGFGQSHAAQFPPTSFAGEQLATLKSVLDSLETHISAQSSGRGTAREKASALAAACDELIRDLEAISRTARAMAITTPGLGEKFRTPHNESHQMVLAVARAAATAALPLKAEFIKRGLPADFLDDLQADIALMEEAIEHKNQGTESHVLATAAIDAEIERGMNAVRELDSIAHNIFAADPSTLAAWTSASHVERPTRRKTPATQGTTTTTPPTPPAPAS